MFPDVYDDDAEERAGRMSNGLIGWDLWRIIAVVREFNKNKTIDKGCWDQNLLATHMLTILFCTVHQNSNIRHHHHRHSLVDGRTDGQKHQHDVWAAVVFLRRRRLLRSLFYALLFQISRDLRLLLLLLLLRRLVEFLLLLLLRHQRRR